MPKKEFVTVMGKQVSMDDFKKAFHDTAKAQYDTAVKNITNMPPHVEDMLKSTMGVDKKNLLAHAEQFNPTKESKMSKVKLKVGKETTFASETAHDMAQTQSAQPAQDPIPSAGKDAVAVDGKVLKKGDKIILSPVVTKYEPDFPQLETVSNPETGSLFHVIGSSPEGLRISIRMYLNKSDPGFTRMDFRLRIGDILPNAPGLSIPVPALIESKYPALYAAVANSSKSHSKHCSIEGALLLPCDPWEKSQLEALASGTLFAKELRTALMDAFGEGTMLIGDDHLRHLITTLTMAAVKELPVPNFVTADKTVQYRVGLTQQPLLIRTAQESN